jgi:hypothetical protein
MTETTDNTIRRDIRPHLGELKLRRFLAGESLGTEHEAAAAHVAGCAECGRRLDAFGIEQRAFQNQISFDRFAAGVERAARVPSPPARSHWWSRPATTRSFVTMLSLGSAAAVLALVMGVRPLFQAARLRSAADMEIERTNRIKGDVHAAVTIRIAPQDDGPQRSASADAVEPLAVGERIRVGVQPGLHRFLFAVSVDDKGSVTPLYPEVGISMPLPRGGRLQYLPDSLELTGKGSERLIVLLTDEPLEFDSILHAVKKALARVNGNLAQLPHLALAGEQFHRMFLKP